MLRRPKVVYSLIVLGLGLILVLLPSRLNDQLKRLVGWAYLPLVGVANGVEQVGHRSSAYLTPRSQLLEEIDRLRRENRKIRLQSFQASEVFRENARLRAMVQWRARQSWDLRLARVVVEDPVNWWRSIVLDAGEKQGIGVDDPVLTDQGLVGKVIAVSGHQSRVALLGDPNCRVAAMLLESGHPGIVTPSADGVLNHRIVELKHLPSDAPLKPGLEVATSGAGGVFPKGIPIGHLIDSQSYDFGLYAEARVRLQVNLDRLDYIWVIVDQDEREQDGQP
ncbi:MAG: Cell shape-determining protein MreC [Verrucomicrobia subdivision 3 bacterium]|nr:Cell shape-determining protein MreC [Limisphaerales bacterium]MCS1413063.1 Cell shape-determining protein MreC [Limisphaerales bacterium]